MEEMKSLLDSLMGKNRNEINANNKYSFKDDNVCKYYLIDFCPHDLFPNTKSDIGKCKNIHSEVLKEQLENDENYKYYLAKYEQKFMKMLEKIIETAEIKIEKSKEKLKHLLSNNKNTIQKKAKIDSINEHICDLLKQAEEAGEMGDLIKATNYNNQVNMLQEKIKKLNEENDETKNNEINLKVCEICGAMQSVGDVIQRFENHVNGKQHLGYEKIRNTYNKLKEGIEERKDIIEKYKKLKNEKENINESKKKKKDYSSDSDNRRNRNKRNDYYKKEYYNKKRSRHRKTYEYERNKNKRRKYSSYNRSNTYSSDNYEDKYRRYSKR